MNFDFRPMDEVGVRQIHTWRYPPPYEIYGMNADTLPELLGIMLDPANAYYRIEGEDGELAAYCCFGPDARVPGGDYGAPALDIGMGLRPDLTGLGRGSSFVQAVLEFARREFAPEACRVTVAGFNERALRVWQKAEFQPAQTFARDPDGMAFTILTRQT
jgi:ribosomal-protein-alanine N-acetyltransferase